MKPRLALEALESRETPAAFGNPWPDGEHLTLSFARDGTPVAGVPSDLQAAWGAAAPQARLAVLRAFQTWAVNANLNFGLVGDTTGAAFGTGGAVQGDSRFGDIRVAGIPLNADVLAVTAPYSQYDNYSGNVVLNTAAAHDLYTEMLQEAGHALGVDNSPDLASVMYEFYLGSRAGLSSGDVASIQALYGARQPDQYEGLGGNGTRATATPFLNPATGDISSAADADVYKVTTGLLTNRIEVNLHAAGLSLFTGRVDLLDASGNILATKFTTDPTDNDLSITLGNARSLTTYYVRVTGATSDVFSVGSYELDVTQNSVVTGVTGTLNLLLNETGLNDTLFTATSLLSNTLTVGPRTEYSTDARFGSASDVDYYQVAVPPSPTGGPVALLATAWGQNGAVLNPWVEVRDAFGNRVAADVLTGDGNTTTIQVRNVTPGATYYIRVSSDSGGTGGYHLSADLTRTPTVPARGATGTLAATASTNGVLDVPMTGQVHFSLAADGGAAELTVAAADGTVVATLSVVAGRGRSVDLFLAAGRYQVTVRKLGTAATSFRLFLSGVTDPVGAKKSDPTTTTGTSPGTGTNTSSSSSSSTQPSWYVPPQSSQNATWY